jgi:tetratricopeptide (TPR) repeat protein
MTATNALKAVGAIGAVVSLLLGLNQLTGVVQRFRIHRQEFSEAMASGAQQQRRGEIAAAFRSFKHAVELDPIDRDAQASEAQAAMLWIETVHENESQKFSEVANQLLPVLDAALVRAKGSEAGDLLAHIAWANSLKYRDGLREGIDVDGNLKAALLADPNNVYAHAMSGWWILAQNGDMKSAESHFSAALATGRVRPYVRELQVGALTSGDSAEKDAAALRVANDMRKSGEMLDSSVRRTIFWKNFSSEFHSKDRLAASLSVLSPQDTESTYDWLDDRPADDVKKWSRAFVVANLSEVQGHRAEALAQYKALQKQLRNTNSSLMSDVDAAVVRLSRSTR